MKKLQIVRDYKELNGQIIKHSCLDITMKKENSKAKKIILPKRSPTKKKSDYKTENSKTI